MERYELLLFAHIVFVILWLGGGTMFHIIAFRVMRNRDSVGLEKLFDNLVALANVFFIPSSLLVVISGVLLTIDGPWTFGTLWIVLGLAGFAATFITGVGWLGPQSEKVKAVIERDRGMSAEADALTRRMVVFARIDYVILFLIVFDMTIKPTGDDTGVLVLMAAILAATAGLLLWRARSVDVPSPAAGPEATPG